MSKQPVQSKTIQADLLAAMTCGEYATPKHLPPEKELSEKLCISRTQLRDILAALEREGFITRRHGVGTIINRHVLDIPLRMDIETEFLDMIRQSGFEPSVLSVQVSADLANEKNAHLLKISPGDPVIRVSRLCAADGKPAVFCEDLIPKRLVKHDYTMNDLKKTIFDFLHTACGVSAYLDVTNIRPVAADAPLSEIFRVPEGTPLLHMEEVDFDVDGNPVFLSNQYFIDGVFRHTVIRKKL